MFCFFLLMFDVRLYSLSFFMGASARGLILSGCVEAYPSVTWTQEHVRNGFELEVAHAHRDRVVADTVERSAVSPASTASESVPLPSESESSPCVATAAAAVAATAAVPDTMAQVKSSSSAASEEKTSLSSSEYSSDVPLGRAPRSSIPVGAPVAYVTPAAAVAAPAVAQASPHASSEQRLRAEVTAVGKETQVVMRVHCLQIFHC
jgi:hypothetical protein